MMKEYIDGMASPAKPLPASQIVFSALWVNAVFIGVTSLILYGLFHLDWMTVWNDITASVMGMYHFIVDQSWVYFPLVLIGFFTSFSVKHRVCDKSDVAKPPYENLAWSAHCFSVFFLMLLIMGVIAKLVSLS